MMDRSYCRKKKSTTWFVCAGCNRARCFGAWTDGIGTEFRCRLERDQGRWWGKVEEVRTQRQPLLKVTLAQSLVKRDRFEWILEKATELGVWEIVPILTWRTEVRLGVSTGVKGDQFRRFESTHPAPSARRR